MNKKDESFKKLEERTLVVRKFDPDQITKELLEELFSNFGPVNNIILRYDHAFVEFSEPESVAYAIAMMWGICLHGRRLSLSPKISSDFYYKYLESLRTFERKSDNDSEFLNQFLSEKQKNEKQSAIKKFETSRNGRRNLLERLDKYHKHYEPDSYYNPYFKRDLYDDHYNNDDYSRHERPSHHFPTPPPPPPSYSGYGSPHFDSQPFPHQRPPPPPPMMYNNNYVPNQLFWVGHQGPPPPPPMPSHAFPSYPNDHHHHHHSFHDQSNSYDHHHYKHQRDLHRRYDEPRHRRR